MRKLESYCENVDVRRCEFTFVKCVTAFGFGNSFVFFLFFFMSTVIACSLSG